MYKFCRVTYTSKYHITHLRVDFGISFSLDHHLHHYHSWRHRHMDIKTSNCVYKWWKNEYLMFVCAFKGILISHTGLNDLTSVDMPHCPALKHTLCCQTLWQALQEEHFLSSLDTPSTFLLCPSIQHILPECSVWLCHPGPHLLGIIKKIQKIIFIQKKHHYSVYILVLVYFDW